MSVRNKVNVVNSVQYPSSLRRFITEGKDETSAGIFSSGNHGWVTNGDKLSIVDTAKGCPRPVYSFGEDSKDPVDITCIEELVLDCTTPTPLLLVGTSSLYNSQLCVFNPAQSRVVRAIELDNLQVRCMAVVEDGRSPLNSLTDVLSAMEGVVALGCADGSVVLIDLNRQTIVKAYQGNRLYQNTESTPLPLKFVSTVDEEATIIEIGQAQESGENSAITLIKGDGEDTEFGVTALTFSRETACLYIGYSSGLWQIWNLSFSTFTMMYECAECTNPVSNFCQIEPCEDPRPTIYLWVNHEGSESSMPLLNMYTLSYANKLHVPDYGIYYQDFISSSLSFSMYPGEEFPNVTSGRLVSAKAYSKTIKRHLIQNMGLPEMEGIQMKLVATTFSLTYTRGSTHTYLCVFDLDQWYKEQMPHESNPDVPYIETVELCSEPLIASTVLIDSISLYHTEEPQEIHLVPQALSYKVVGLSENGLMTIEKIGLQKLWLANTEAIGAKSLVHPTKLFHACVSAGLVPMFHAHQNTETSAPTNEEMRSYIMSVCLDNGLIKTILDIGEQWESGVHATSNCTLNFLFEWVWSSVSTAYKSVNGICDTLFSASGQELDVSLKRRLQLSRLILDRLYYIHTAFCSKYNHTLYSDTLEPRLKAIDIITLFVHQVSWFMNVGLLPEANSKDLPKTAIRYDYLKLDRFAVDRRQRLNTLFAKFKRSGKSHELPGAGLYLVDHFVHDYNELGQQWEDEGGSTAYPPPSIQSLLRSLRIQTVPTSTKLALVQYTLLDIMSVIDKSKHEDLVSKVGTFHLLPKINTTQTKVINGLWHLDHSLFEEGLQYLLDRTVTVSDLSEGLHRAILRMLLFEGKGKLAIQYLRLKNPPLSLPDDLKLEMSLLLANKLTSQAYHFQRGHTYLRETLLRQLFSECLVNGELGKLVNFPLDESEINFFHNHLAKNRCQRNDDLRVLLLISRSKYNEAKVLHEKLMATSTDRDQLKTSTRDMIVNGLASTVPPISREIYLQKIDPNLKNLPEFKSSKPRPLSVYVKTIDDGGFPNFAVSSQKLCASALACSANLWRFVGHKNEKSRFNEILREEPMICSEENTSLWSKQEPETSAPGKRAGNWVSGANKRQKMDMDASVKDEDIAAFVGTPLVKRRSRELADPTTPLSTAKKPPVQSILKSGKTPGTPGRSALVIHDDLETPKKTLRWDIPTSESQGGKEAVKKSLLSTSLLTPSKDPVSSPVKPSDPAQESLQTPQDTASIKSRLRSHTPSSASKKDVGIWNEIAEEAKAKVLFSLNLPAKKEKKLLPSKPVGPSFVVQINQLIEEEKRRKESDLKKDVQLPPGEFSVACNDGPLPKNVESVKREETTDPENEDVEMKEATPSQGRSKRLRFCDITIDSGEKSLLDLSGSPFTTTVIPREFREQLGKKSRSSNDQAENCKTTVDQNQKILGVQKVTDESQSTPGKITSPEKKYSKVLFAESSSTKPDDDDDEFVIDELPSEVPNQIEKKVIELPTITVEEPDTPEKHNEDVPLSTSSTTLLTSSAAEDGDSKSVSDSVKGADEFRKPIESIIVASDESKNITCKDKSLNDFAAQTIPQIGNVVSLSRTHYAEDEDEVGSEDPEEAEIPPIIEFSQPEEGLVIDASYALKENSERPDEFVEHREDDENELEDVSRVVEGKPDNDSGSSVICIDSDSEGEQKSPTQLDYDDYEEDSYSLDSEEAEQSSRGRRSFFHDKYNTHQEESEESPSPEYSSGEDDKRDSDVDLYNMDDIEENDGLPKEDELDDEIFAMGRGIQKSKDLDMSSEEEDEEEEEIEDEEEEEEDDEVAEVTPVAPNTSEPTSLGRTLPDNVIQEVLSSEEEDASVAKVVSKPQLSQESETGSSRSDSPSPATIPDQIENQESNISSENKQQVMQDEDQSAVNALLGLEEPPNDDADSTKESNSRDNDISREPAVEIYSTENEQNKAKYTPSKSTDVIDILNLSQGQMFFGSPEVQLCDKPPDRALFQLGTSSFNPKCSESDENKFNNVDIIDPPTKPQNEVLDVSTNEETLVLRLEESDIVRAKSPEVQPTDPEVVTLPNYFIGSTAIPSECNLTSPKLTTSEIRDVLVVEPATESVSESPSKLVVSESVMVDEVEEPSVSSSLDSSKYHQTSTNSKSTETVEVVESTETVAMQSSLPSHPLVSSLPIKDQVQHASFGVQADPLEDVKELSNRVTESVVCQTSFANPRSEHASLKSFSCQAAMDTTKYGGTLEVVETTSAKPAHESVTSTCDAVESEQNAPKVNQDIQFSSQELADSTLVQIVLEPPTPFKKIVSDKDMVMEKQESEKANKFKDSNLGVVKLDNSESEEQTAELTVADVPVDEPMDDSVVQDVESDNVKEPIIIFPLDSSKIEQTSTNSKDTRKIEVVDPLEDAKELPNPVAESVDCQTSFANPSPKHASLKSFSCQAAMDITKYGRTLEGVDTSPSKPSQGSVTSTCETVESEQNVPTVHQDTQLSSREAADSTLVQIVLEPPTPFKILRDEDMVMEKQEPGNANRFEDSDLGVVKLDNSESEEQTAGSNESNNPCDLAFVDESIASMTATPKTPRQMTPLRKSVRLSKCTPGRAIVPDDEVNVSDSMLDIAVLDPELSDEKPVLVDRSMITDKHGLEKTIIAGQSTVSSEKEVKPRKGTHKSSLEKLPKEQRKSSKRLDEGGFDLKEIVSTESKHDRVEIVDPEEVKELDAKKRRPSVRDVESRRPKQSKSSRASSSEPEDGDRLKKSRHSRASTEPEDGSRHKKPRQSRASMDSDKKSGHSNKPEDGGRRRRSSSAQPETRDYAVQSEKRRGRRSQSIDQEISRKDTQKSSASLMSSESEASNASRNRDQARRHSSLEPEANPKWRGSRRASSEGPSSDVHHGSSKKRRSSSTVDSNDGSPSPPKLRKPEEPFEVSDEGEYRKRKIRHSITEPLEKKKHQLEEQSSGEPKSKMPRSSELPVEDVSTDSSGSVLPRKSRSLHEYPVGRSVRTSKLASIQELPEESPRPRQSKTSMRASTDNLTALDSLMSSTNRIDISKWMALSSSQVSRARRLSGKASSSKAPAKNNDTEHLDMGAFLKTLETPKKDEATSPTGSVASITSTASSKVLRSGRVIDENTPTKRTRELSAKQRAARSLKLSESSPAKVLRSGRAVGDDERLTATTDADGDEEMDEARGGSENTSVSSAVSNSETPDYHHHEMSIAEVMSSRRLTRHQRSVLENTMASTPRGRQSPAGVSPSPVPKRKSKKP